MLLIPSVEICVVGAKTQNVTAIKKLSFANEIEYLTYVENVQIDSPFHYFERVFNLQPKFDDQKIECDRIYRTDSALSTFILYAYHIPPTLKVGCSLSFVPYSLYSPETFVVRGADSFDSLLREVM